MADWRDKLREQMTEKGFNMKSLSKKAGLGDTYVRDLLVRDRDPRLKMAIKICDVLDVPLQTIFGSMWEGVVDELDEEEALPIPAFEGFTPVGRFDASFSMGPGSLIPDDPEPLGYWVFETHWLRALSAVSPDNLAVVKVDGDSMVPTLHDGDLVLVDRANRRLNREGLYAIKVGDTAWVKRISLNLKSQKIRVLSDNPLVPKQPEMDEEELSVVGRVIALVARKLP
jgi:lambda repressor-like predicted transcriptional regulator